jgi:hypothetical protein
MLLYTLLYISFAFALAPHMDLPMGLSGAAGAPGATNMARAAMLLLTVAYGTALILFIKINSTRRMDDWDKQYWRSGELKRAASAAADLARSSGAKCKSTSSGGVPQYSGLV